MDSIMKKYFFLMLAVAGMAAAGCAKIDPKQSVETDAEARVVTVGVSADSFILRSDTKVASDNDGNFTWEADDAIGVWTGSQITKFTLSSGAGSAKAQFSATLTGSETVDENSYAVYPYGSVTVEGTNITVNTGRTDWSAPRRFVPMFAKAGTGHTTGFSFKMLSAVVKFTLRNRPSDWKWIYFENYGTAPFSIFPAETATAQTTDAFPTISGTNKGDWPVVLPDLGGYPDVVDFYLPLLPGDSYSSNVLFKFKPQKTLNTFSDVDNSLRRTGKFTDISTLSRGQLLVVPDLIYGVQASIEGDLAWKSGMTMNLFRGTTSAAMTLDGSYVGNTEGMLFGAAPVNPAFGVSSTGSTGISVAGSTLTITNNGDNYPTNYALYGTPDASGNYAMKHLGATVHLTLNNIPAATNYIFLECGGRQFFYKNATADLSAATPVLTGTSTGENAWIAVPEHTGDIAQLVVDIPILAGDYATPSWGFKAECYTSIWGTKTSSKPQSNEIVTDGHIYRGDVLNVNLTFSAL